MDGGPGAGDVRNIVRLDQPLPCDGRGIVNNATDGRLLEAARRPHVAAERALRILWSARPGFLATSLILKARVTSLQRPVTLVIVVGCEFAKAL